MSGACHECAGADVNDALLNAVENEHVQCVKRLLSAGADVNIRNCDESPLLLVAA